MMSVSDLGVVDAQMSHAVPDDQAEQIATVVGIDVGQVDSTDSPCRGRWGSIEEAAQFIGCDTNSDNTAGERALDIECTRWASLAAWEAADD